MTTAGSKGHPLTSTLPPSVPTSKGKNVTSLSDPNTLLDRIDSFRGASVNLPLSGNGKAKKDTPDDATNDTTSNGTTPNINTNPNTNSNTNSNGHGNNNNNNNNKNIPGSTSEGEFDPIDFLNHHYKTESSLISALPDLRHTLRNRITSLDDSISTTIQKQSELADITISDVSRAKLSIVQLHERITTVQEKARLSEKTVQEITRDMKRLDYAKKHLSRTITALKRLHMLFHAVTQLHHCVRESTPFPEYKNAANLMDATHLLLTHFEGYMKSVEKIRLLKDDVDAMKVELREGIVFGFRVVGFGLQKALEKKQGNKKTSSIQRKLAAAGATIPSTSTSTSNSTNTTKTTTTDMEGKQDTTSEEDTTTTTPTLPMPPNVMTDACHALDSLSSHSRSDFLSLFCKDHLEAYDQLFNPQHNTSAAGVATPSTPKPSFKLNVVRTNSAEEFNMDNTIHGKENTSASNPNPASLDQCERRYAWYRRMLRELEDKFPSVFPSPWNVHYHMTHTFLSMTYRHILMLFSSKEGKDSELRDRDTENVTALLKALQKTMLFEKEMTAWLQRDYKTIFLDDDDHDKVLDGGTARNSAVTGEDGEALEFDESGKAVAASSAEGIRIKYERKMKERKKRENAAAAGNSNANTQGNEFDNLGLVEEEYHQNEKKNQVVPVPPLIGVASCAFDKYMRPYIQLEEQNMDEMLVEATSDTAVDTRGDLPVFTSSTGLFVYIKNSITRCTVLTKGKTLYLLYQAFQDTLRKYAQVLSGKLPQAQSVPAMTAAMSVLNIGALGSNSSALYRISKGEEKTICYVIDTCEYCSDTLEALQDLIADKIEGEYKTKIDMSEEQGAFQDVTAKGIHVLVSGLAQRTETAFKEMFGINWGTFTNVEEESKYVISMTEEIQPIVRIAKGLLPNSYFRTFCDKFATMFTNAFYTSIIRCKRINETGTQQLLLDVYNLKTLFLKLPVLEATSDGKSPRKNGSGTTSTSRSSASASTIAPAMYTKMVTKQFLRIETLLKLVGTPAELLIDVFRVQWSNGSALDLQHVMNLKGMKRNEQAAMLEKFGVDPAVAMKAANATVGTTMTENIQLFQDRSSDVAAKVNSDLTQMRQKVEDFRKVWK